METLYPRYQLLFLFDNLTSHLIFASDGLWVDEINKRNRVQQKFLQNGWYINNKRTLLWQKMTFLKLGIIFDMLPLRV